MKIKYKLLAPVSHIGETASTGSYFQTILTAYGKIPVITGNSIRGQIRDSMAIDLLQHIGCKVEKETFHVLFSGGNINASMKDDVEKAKKVREHFPGISLLGAGLGDMILAGKMVSGFAYPVCEETEKIIGESSSVSWHNLIDEIEFTRMDDSKSDKLASYITDTTEEKTAKASTQMRFSVQYIAAGTEFVQDIRFLQGITELELGAFYASLAKWFECPRLGGMASKGFGLFDAEVGDDMRLIHGELSTSEHVKNLITRYHSFVESEGAEWFSILSTGGAKKNGKKTDKAD